MPYKNIDETNNCRKSIQNVFDSYCKKVLRNQAKDIWKEYKRRKKRIVLFSEMQQSEIEKLSIISNEFKEKIVFTVLGINISVGCEKIASAIKALKEQKKIITLLSYFYGLSDIEISRVLDIPRSTVQYKRTSALSDLKNYMEAKHHEKQ